MTSADGEPPVPDHRSLMSPAWSSAPELLVLHALRLTGVADDVAVARSTALDERVVTELLHDDEAFGWVTRVEFADVRGWMLTERGRAADERQLAEELARAGARAVVEQAHRTFESLNARLLQACTDWQLRPTAQDRLAANDHGDPRWDARVVDELSTLAIEVEPVVDELRRALARFSGYDERFSAALSRVRAGEHQWVAGVGIPSCHTVWMQLHEDLLSTLGIPRGVLTERQ